MRRAPAEPTQPTEPTFNYEYDELMNRADELEVPIPAPTNYSPKAPSALVHATRAAQQLALDAADMRRYMAAGYTEWANLAESLRNAAKAYEETDSSAADSITNETSMVTSTGTGSVVPSPYTEADLAALTYTSSTQATEIEPMTYYPVEDAAYDIAEPDQGVDFDSFAAEWESYQFAMRQAFERFRPFEYWEGDAAYAAAENMEKQRDWLSQMADRCGTMATEARAVAAAQRKAFPLHPTIEEIEGIQQVWIMYQTDPSLQPLWPITKPQLEMKLQYYQEQSEQVLADYVKDASLPLTPAQPNLPPMAYTGSGGSGNLPAYPTGGKGLPSGGGGAGSGLAGADTTPPDDTTPTDLSSTPPVLPPPGSSMGSGGVKPASLGAGGIGAGVPMMPLDAPIDAGSATRPSAAGLVGLPGGAAGARGGAGGAGMPAGGAPGGKNQNDKKGKRIDQGDEAIYKEMRPWTAAVIGNRRRNDLPETNVPVPEPAMAK